MLNEIKTLKEEITAKIASIKDLVALEDFRLEYLVKKGKLQLLVDKLKDVPKEQKPQIGKELNIMKSGVEKQFNELRESLQEAAEDTADIDVTLPGRRNFTGAVHPVIQTMNEMISIFAEMGFTVAEGPDIEDGWHNFDSLNFPPDHPARDMQDTFWFHDPSTRDTDEKKFLLRTHTSTIQVRGMQSRKPPFRFIAPGVVFRCERTDASHEMVFTQLEGMMVGKDISVSNLIYFMKTILKEIFKKDVEVRLRPGFFPFVEPGFELDIRCLICEGKGCSVCKQIGWVELLPCGMVHPNVLRAGGIDPEEYNGFAFGLGLDRLVMMKYGIDDIRHLQSGDLRFNSQFKLY